MVEKGVNGNVAHDSPVTLHTAHIDLLFLGRCLLGFLSRIIEKYILWKSFQISPSYTIGI